ncbi:MAG: 1-acyl-sn-glycerol-3-phosphate acyltransferase [Ruminococcaceae bacterium]|nr:1-acyl-sn-glycerol-3-phosphate acyltransferase [Oscillospiraceae bacterium]
MKGKFYAVFHFCFGWLIRLIFRVRIVGRQNEPTQEQGPYLVCANHQTLLDPILVCAATKRQQPHFMAKAELFKIPVLRGLIRKLGAYPVSRGKSDVGAVKHAIALLQSGRSVGLFPQGTRCPEQNPRDCKIKFGAGLIASRAGAQVLPVHIKMKNNKWKFLRRVTVIIGQPIPFADLGYEEGVAGEYARVSEQIYDVICRLGEEAGK